MKRIAVLIVTVLSMYASHKTALADMAQVRVTVENLSPAGSVTFAPLHVGFHGGTYDAFNSGARSQPGHYLRRRRRLAEALGSRPSPRPTPRPRSVPCFPILPGPSCRE